MLSDPIEEGSLETDVVTKTFRLEPFMFENLLPFGQEFLVETRLLHKLTGGGRLWCGRCHAGSSSADQSERAMSVNARNFSKSLHWSLDSSQIRGIVECASLESSVSPIWRK